MLLNSGRTAVLGNSIYVGNGSNLASELALKSDIPDLSNIDASTLNGYTYDQIISSAGSNAFHLIKDSGNVSFSLSMKFTKKDIMSASSFYNVATSAQAFVVAKITVTLTSVASSSGCWMQVGQENSGHDVTSGGNILYIMEIAEISFSRIRTTGTYTFYTFMISECTDFTDIIDDGMVRMLKIPWNRKNYGKYESNKSKPLAIWMGDTNSSTPVTGTVRCEFYGI